MILSCRGHMKIEFLLRNKQRKLFKHLLRNHLAWKTQTCLEVSSGSADFCLFKSWLPSVWWGHIGNTFKKGKIKKILKTFNTFLTQRFIFAVSVEASSGLETKVCLNYDLQVFGGEGWGFYIYIELNEENFLKSSQKPLDHKDI